MTTGSSEVDPFWAHHRVAVDSTLVDLVYTPNPCRFITTPFRERNTPAQGGFVRFLSRG